jgi:hypothetical protein
MDTAMIPSILLMGALMLAMLYWPGYISLAACVLFPQVAIPTFTLGLVLRIVAMCRSAEYVPEFAAPFVDPNKQARLSVSVVCVLGFAAFSLALRKYKTVRNKRVMLMYLLATCLRMLVVFDTSWYMKGWSSNGNDKLTSWSIMDWFAASIILLKYRMFLVSKIDMLQEWRLISRPGRSRLLS